MKAEAMTIFVVTLTANSKSRPHREFVHELTSKLCAAFRRDLWHTIGEEVAEYAVAETDVDVRTARCLIPGGAAELGIDLRYHEEEMAKYLLPAADASRVTARFVYGAVTALQTLADNCKSANLETARITSWLPYPEGVEFHIFSGRSVKAWGSMFRADQVLGSSIPA